MATVNMAWGRYTFSVEMASITGDLCEKNVPRALGAPPQLLLSHTMSGDYQERHSCTGGLLREGSPCRFLAQGASSAAWQTYVMAEPPKWRELGAHAVVDCSYKLHKIAFLK